MVSDGGVHSGFEHLHALIELAASSAWPISCCTASPTGAIRRRTPGEQLPGTAEEWCGDAGAGRIATVIGRYYAMDRDRAGSASRRPTTCSSRGGGEHSAATGAQAARDAYARGETDEFITPTTVGARRAGSGPATACSASTSAPTECARSCARSPSPAFGERRGPARLAGAVAPHGALATMTEYQQGWAYPVAFRSARAATRSGARDREVRSTPAARGRDREVRPCHLLLQRRRGAGAARRAARAGALQRDVPTYDLKPQMSARAVVDAFGRVRRRAPRFSVINFANADMVGHTGVIPATIGQSRRSTNASAGS